MLAINHHLDLRGVACPMNFVKAKLFLDKIELGAVLEVLLDAGEPADNVSSSIQAEGHRIFVRETLTEGHCRLCIRKG